MNPWELSASDLLIWGIVLHLIADWPLQNDWMATNKANLWYWAGYVHASIHGILLSIIFGWAAIPLAIVHLLIDTRVPVIWWSKLIGQTQSQGSIALAFDEEGQIYMSGPLYDIGTEVRFWTDQVFHIVCIAIAALLVTV